ncbi:hypothetical protein [Qaidamihabitans albus]|uniref:hypothetical protein n=1 Tax=Qaidamihabitans albus TaxID=2795733 RepID=UPI0018F16B90|nr:hypothetical protein [Qaidamihabitans albus]
MLHDPPASARPDVLASCFDALAAYLVGDREGAWQRIDAALRAAHELAEPYALALAHSFHARLAVLGRDTALTTAAAGKAISIADEHGFPLLRAHAAIPQGWARAADGELEAGLAVIERGLTQLHRHEQRILAPFHSGLRAEVLLKLGRPDTALAAVDDALAEAAGRGEAFAVPSLNHLRGIALDTLGRAALGASRAAPFPSAGGFLACCPFHELEHGSP